MNDKRIRVTDRLFRPNIWLILPEGSKAEVTIEESIFQQKLSNLMSLLSKNPGFTRKLFINSLFGFWIGVDQSLLWLEFHSIWMNAITLSLWLTLMWVVNIHTKPIVKGIEARKREIIKTGWGI